MDSSLRSAIGARFTPGRIALAVGLIAGVLGISALLENESAGAPADHAAALVPIQALVYVHASVDPESDQWKNATSLVRRFPRLERFRDRALRGLTPRGARLDLERQVYPWLGDEAALALLGGTQATARSLILLEVSDSVLARDFLARAVGRVRKTRYHRVGIDVYGKLATAFLDDFLAIGQPENVRAAIDAWQGRITSLATHGPLRRARAGLPDEDRLLYAYASRDGVRRVLGAQPGLTGRLVKLVDDAALEGAAVALRPEKRGVRVDFSSVLLRTADRRGSKQRFTPELLEVVPRDAIAFIGARGADRIFERITAVAGGSSLSIPAGLRRLGSDLAGVEGTRIRRALRPLLQEEAALFVSPSGAAPLITLVVNRVSRSEAARLIERFQPLLTRLITRPAVGQVPTFQPRRIAGLDAASLRISPSLELTYSIFRGRAVVSTSPKGIREVKRRRPGITKNPLFESDLRDGLDSVSSVLFLDVEQILALGEQAGLGETSSYRAFKADFSRVEALSAVTQNKPASRRAAIFIEVQ